MRILTLSNLYPPHYVGGYELRCAATVRVLRDRGHQVRVLTSDYSTGASTEPREEQEVQRALRLHGFFGRPWLGIRALRELERHNNQTLRDAILQFRPDVVHVWNLGGISKSFCLTLQRLGIPVVYDVSDHWIARSLAADVWLDWWNRPNPSWKAKCLRAWWSVTGHKEHWDQLTPLQPVTDIRFPRIYFCSEALRCITADKGYAVEHGAVVYCPVDTTRFSGEAAPASRELRKLLYVGRLAPDKGVMTALRAMLAVRGQFAGELHVYGHGDAAYTADLQRFVAQHALPVFFHSAGSAEMPAVYRSHDALLFTSEWEEPFALTPLEAMASGLPVIGTMTGGSRELFRHGQNALTYTAGNPEELAQRICELDRSPSLRESIARTGQEQVRQQFAEPAIMDQIERYLLQSVNAPVSKTDMV